MYKIPKYINKPLTFLGLELIDVVFIYVAVFYSYVVESPLYLILSLSGVVWFIQTKRKNPQGFYKHVLYFATIYKLDFYPSFMQQEFLE
jgi:hypothetical protein